MTAAASTLQQQNDALQSTNAELRSANEALVLAGARYLLLHDLAPTPLVTVDHSGHITDVNHAGETMLGSTRPQLLGRCFAAFLDERHRRELSKLFETGVLHGLEVSLPREAAVIDLMIDAVVLPGTIPPRALLACVDLTARKAEETARQRALEQVQEAHRLESLGVLAGGVAHRFNSLMTVVLAGTDHVLSELAPGSSHIEPLTEVRQAASDAGGLAHQMLAYAGHVRVPVQPVDLALLIRDLEPLIRASVRSTPITLDLPARLPFIAGDSQQLRQVVLELAINAAEALAERTGSIAIVVRATESRSTGARTVCVEVRDEGVGMSPATQSRVFEPYFTTKSAGRGLGLAVVHGVVRAHGGELRVISGLERGTTVSIELPAIADPGLADPGSGSSAPPHGGTVLVVDDDPTVRGVLKRALTKLGFDVVIAASGQAALAAIREAAPPIQLLITDLTMPEMDGTVLARLIRTEYPDLPIVLLTGYGEWPADSAGLFTAALSKPFELGTLRDVMRGALVTGPP